MPRGISRLCAPRSHARAGAPRLHRSEGTARYGRPELRLAVRAGGSSTLRLPLRRPVRGGGKAVSDRLCGSSALPCTICYRRPVGRLWAVHGGHGSKAARAPAPGVLDISLYSVGTKTLKPGRLG